MKIFLSPAFSEQDGPFRTVQYKDDRIYPHAPSITKTLINTFWNRLFIRFPTKKHKTQFHSIHLKQILTHPIHRLIYQEIWNYMLACEHD